ncbi:hypothetical protein OIE68_12785 [Nocardia vinacea]|uniref:hypothetical protein n=1 Tax=Nocardia vinacea TaxID=96468 RepID=UPI002E132DFE|nr:hypothetical protein OIE68_12785 [Nocardia vinacea]
MVALFDGSLEPAKGPPDCRERIAVPADMAVLGGDLPIGIVRPALQFADQHVESVTRSDRATEVLAVTEAELDRSGRAVYRVHRRCCAARRTDTAGSDRTGG